MGISANTNISSGDLTSQATGTKTVTMPAGASSTSIVILNWGIFTTGNNVTITPPSGWAAVVAAVTATNIRQYTFWSLGNNANLGFTFTNPGGSCDLGWIATDYLSCDTATPIDATGSSTTNSGASSISAAAVTIVTANAWEIICESDVNDGVASATGYTVKSNGSTLHMRPTILYNTTPKSIGSTGTVTVSNAGSSSGQELIVQPFALRPAAAGGGGTDFMAILGADADMQDVDGGFGRVASRGRSYSFPRRMVPPISPRFERAASGLFLPRGIERTRGVAA